MKRIFALLMIVSPASFAIQLSQAESIVSVTLPGGKFSYAEGERKQCLVFVRGQGVAILEEWGVGCDETNYESYLGLANYFDDVSIPERGVYLGQFGMRVDTRKCDNSESSSAVFTGYHEPEYGTTFSCRRIK